MRNTQGLFDIQINGFAGVDFNDADSLTPDKLDQALEAMLACGVTYCLPTLITAAPEILIARFKALDHAVQNSILGTLMVPGYHLEGPFLNPEDGYAGCHPKECMCAPDSTLIDTIERQLSRPILLITYAPEQDHALCFTKQMVQRGKVLSAGHSNVNVQILNEAVQAGLQLSTHLGNGLPQQLHKFDNTFFAQLGCESLHASFIADGIHIPPYVLKTLLRLKGISHSILVTDAVSAAATSTPGIYPFAGFEIERVADGTVRVPGSVYLAGSSLTLDQGIRNLMQWDIATFEDSIIMASSNPKALLDQAFKHYDITLPPSKVVWNADYEVVTSSVGSVDRTYNH